MGLFSNLFGGGNFGKIASSIAEHHNRLGSFPDVLSIYYEDFKSRSPSSRGSLKAKVAVSMIEDDYSRAAEDSSLPTVINNYLDLAVMALTVDAAPESHDFFTVMDHSGEAVLKELRKQGLDESLITGNYYKEKRQIFAVFREAAEQGDAEAQCYLAVAYQLGEGIPEDKKAAVNWFRKAAEQGHIGAQRYLGVMYAVGEGVHKDYVQAYA